ncbi:MAG: VWA domain-containing protein, partial [Planctomycetes bacterium]|nr:VWA domain-containing protein [Planctomycetota bacterium]
PIFVLDRSGSMDAAQAELNRQAESCVDYLMDHVSAMAVVNFNGAGTATVDTPLTSDRGHIINGIRNPSQTGGCTAIYDAVVRAVDEAVSKRQDAMIILLTDGQNNSGRAGLNDAVGAAQERGVPCMTVGFCQAGSHEEADLQALANRTTGIYYHTSNFDVQRFVRDHVRFSRARRDTDPLSVAPPPF